MPKALLVDICRKAVSSVLVFMLVIMPSSTYAQSSFMTLLPDPGTMLGLSPAYTPAMIKGLRVHPDRPLLFDFIIDAGKSGFAVEGTEFRAEADRLIKYFLAALTIKEDDLWVNLSPYEKDRMIEDELGRTELGRDMLAQDYVLKQLTASLIYPEEGVGKEFWTRVYAEAQAKFGTIDIPVDTFNKVWITADKAKVLEKNNAAFIVGAHLKVQLESDRHAEQLAQAQPVVNGLGEKTVSLSDDLERSEFSKQMLREVVLPAIEQEVNEGANFALLRQMFYSMILASWYKISLKRSLLNQVYSDQALTSGVENGDPQVKDKIYLQYLEAYKQGVFDFIKEESDLATGQTFPRKYFSGGEDFAMLRKLEISDLAQASAEELSQIAVVGDMAQVTANFAPARSAGAVDTSRSFLDEVREKKEKLLSVIDSPDAHSDTEVAQAIRSWAGFELPLINADKQSRAKLFLDIARGTEAAFGPLSTVAALENIYLPKFEGPSRDMERAYFWDRIVEAIEHAWNSKNVKVKTVAKNVASRWEYKLNDAYRNGFERQRFNRLLSRMKIKAVEMADKAMSDDPTTHITDLQGNLELVKLVINAEVERDVLKEKERRIEFKGRKEYINIRNMQNAKGQEESWVEVLHPDKRSAIFQMIAHERDLTRKTEVSTEEMIGLVRAERDGRASMFDKFAAVSAETPNSQGANVLVKNPYNTLVRLDDASVDIFFERLLQVAGVGDVVVGIPIWLGSKINHFLVIKGQDDLMALRDHIFVVTSDGRVQVLPPDSPAYNEVNEDEDIQIVLGDMFDPVEYSKTVGDEVKALIQRKVVMDIPVDYPVSYARRIDLEGTKDYIYINLVFSGDSVNSLIDVIRPGNLLPLYHTVLRDHDLVDDSYIKWKDIKSVLEAKLKHPNGSGSMKVMQQVSAENGSMSKLNAYQKRLADVAKLIGISVQSDGLLANERRISFIGAEEYINIRNVKSRNGQDESWIEVLHPDQSSAIFQMSVLNKDLTDTNLSFSQDIVRMMNAELFIRSDGSVGVAPNGLRSHGADVSGLVLNNSFTRNFDNAQVVEKEVDELMLARVLMYTFELPFTARHDKDEEGGAEGFLMGLDPFLDVGVPSFITDEMDNGVRILSAQGAEVGMRVVLALTGSGNTHVFVEGDNNEQIASIEVEGTAFIFRSQEEIGLFLRSMIQDPDLEMLYMTRKMLAEFLVVKELVQGKVIDDVNAGAGGGVRLIRFAGQYNLYVQIHYGSRNSKSRSWIQVMSGEGPYPLLSMIVDNRDLTNSFDVTTSEVIDIMSDRITKRLKAYEVQVELTKANDRRRDRFQPVKIDPRGAAASETRGQAMRTGDIVPEWNTYQERLASVADVISGASMLDIVLGQERMIMFEGKKEYITVRNIVSVRGAKECLIEVSHADKPVPLFQMTEKGHDLTDKNIFLTEDIEEVIALELFVRSSGQLGVARDWSNKTYKIKMLSSVDDAMKGGIELNANTMGLDVSKEGSGLDLFQFDPGMLKEFRTENFSGIKATIIKIVPIQSPLPILGFEDSSSEGPLSA